MSLRIGEQVFKTYEFTSVTDGLGDLLRLGIMAATGGSGEAWFCYEPGDLRLTCTRYRDNGRRIPWMSVHAYAVPYLDAPESALQLLFEADCNADEFANAMLEMGRNVLTRFGREGYEAEWGYEFPARALQVLELAVAADEPNLYMANSEDPDDPRTIVLEIP